MASSGKYGMVNNPLQEYLNEDGNLVLIDIDLDEEIANDPQWLKKIKYRIGSIVIEFNYLERQVDEAILEIMNERAEDERVWVFLEKMTCSSKFEALSKHYDLFLNYSKPPEDLLSKKKKTFQKMEASRMRRNLYVHANWHNTVKGELVEGKTKRLKSGSYGRFREKVSVDHIDKDIEDIIELQYDLDELHEEIFSNFYK